MKRLIPRLRPALAAALLAALPATPGTGDGGGDVPVPWVTLRGGHLIYGHDAQGNRLPDFSFAGYGGGVALPTVPVARTLGPDGADDDTARLQQALDAVAARTPDAHGRRGAVRLQPGAYKLAGTLKIDADGVVLCGSGSGDGGTMLVAEGLPHPLIVVGGTGTWRRVGAAHAVADAYVPVGATRFSLDSTDGLAAGDSVIVQRPQEAAWIHALGMDQIPPRPNGTPSKPWRPNAGLLFERTLTAVHGREVTLDVPLTNALERRYTHATVWKYTFPGRLRECGVEHLAADGAAFAAAPGFHDDGFFASQCLVLDAVQDGWAWDVVAHHFGSAFLVGAGALRVSLQDTASLDVSVPQDIHDQPAAYTVSGQQTLVADSRVTGSNVHAWVTQARVAGPNVFTRGTATNTGRRTLDAGPHQRWAAGTLYDALTLTGGGLLELQDRAWMGSGQGWAGANSVLWDCRSDRYRVDAPPTADNWAFGGEGRTVTAPGHASGEIVSPGHPLLPPSLYAAQLADRRR